MTKAKKRTMTRVATGIYLTADDTYHATIGNKTLGTYPTLEQATAVRRAAEEQRGVDQTPSANDDTRGRNGQFLPGSRHGAGRTERRQNKITRDLKEGIITAAILHGQDGKGKGGLVGFLQHLAADYPKPFASLLGRLLPLQVTGNLNNLIGSVNIMPVPVGHYLTAEDAKAMMGVDAEPIIIDQAPFDRPQDDGTNVTPLRPYQPPEEDQS